MEILQKTTGNLFFPENCVCYVCVQTLAKISHLVRKPRVSYSHKQHVRTVHREGQKFSVIQTDELKSDF